MFKITPIQEKELQKSLCKICNTEYRQEAFAYQMYDIDSGEIMGISQFEIAEAGYIYDIKEAPGRDDFEAMFILGRQTMNFIDQCGAHVCYAKEDAGDDRLLTAIGFRIKGNDLFCDMTGMFDGHCGGNKVNL